jgi:hypothetical protein
VGEHERERDRRGTCEQPHREIRKGTTTTTTATTTTTTTTTTTHVLGVAPVVAHWAAPPVRDPDPGRLGIHRKVLADPVDDVLDGLALGGQVRGGENHHGVRPGVGFKRPVGAARGAAHDLLEPVSHLVKQGGVALGPEQKRGDDDPVMAERTVVHRVQGAPHVDLEGRRPGGTRKRRMRSRRRREGHRWFELCCTVLPTTRRSEQSRLPHPRQIFVCLGTKASGDAEAVGNRSYCLSASASEGMLLGLWLGLVPSLFGGAPHDRRRRASSERASKEKERGRTTRTRT